MGTYSSASSNNLTASRPDAWLAASAARRLASRAARSGCVGGSRYQNLWVSSYRAGLAAGLAATNVGQGVTQRSGGRDPAAHLVDA